VPLTLSAQRLGHRAWSSEPDQQVLWRSARPRRHRSQRRRQRRCHFRPGFGYHVRYVASPLFHLESEHPATFDRVLRQPTIVSPRERVLFYSVLLRLPVPKQVSPLSHSAVKVAFKRRTLRCPTRSLASSPTLASISSPSSSPRASLTCLRMFFST